jgi:hypothetical protein
MRRDGYIVGGGWLRPAAANKFGNDPADPDRGGTGLVLPGL